MTIYIKSCDVNNCDIACMLWCLCYYERFSAKAAAPLHVAKIQTFSPATPAMCHRFAYLATSMVGAEIPIPVAGYAQTNFIT